MRPVLAWVVYLGLVLLGGALLAPGLYALAQMGASHLPALEWLARQPFHRFVHRSMLLLALAGLWPLVRYLGIRQWRGLGLGRSPGWWQRLGIGFALGFGTWALVLLVTLGLGVRGWSTTHSLGVAAGHLLAAGSGAVLVGLLEESLFRGALFGTLRRGNRWALAMGLSSVIYAWVHFFAPVRWSGEVPWNAGLTVLQGMARGLVDWPALVPGFLNLCLAGVILAVGYQRTGDLYLSIGLHSGWVFWLKSYGYLTTETTRGRWFWGSDRLIDGWSVFPVLLALLCLLPRVPYATDSGALQAKQ